MDANGARHLLARISAGVRVGTRVELVAVADDSPLRPGDRGVVVGLEQSGRVLVKWDRGITLGIEPDGASFCPFV
jgi:hypothetical protein